MKRTTGRTAVAVVGLMFSTFSARPMLAQWHATGIGVAEYDTKQTLLLLAGLSGSPGGKGVVPTIGAQGYYLTFTSNAVRTNVVTIQPHVGLADNYDGGSVGASIGYSFANKEVRAVSTATGNQGSGTVLSGSWDHWGTGGPMGHQVLGSYNFGSKSLWTRGRITRNMTPGGPSQRRVGVELAYLEGKDYSAYQPGGVLEFHDPKGNILGLGAGMKFFGKGAGSAVYFKAEGVVPLFR